MDIFIIRSLINTTALNAVKTGLTTASSETVIILSVSRDVNMTDTSLTMEQTDMSEYRNPTIQSFFTTLRICLALFGLLANTVTGVVLTNKKLWNPTSMLLLSLVAYDAVFLLASIPPTLVFGIVDYDIFATLVGICYPLRFMAQTGSIYSTVTVTVERFLIVFRPLKARVFCTFGKTRKVILGIFLFSVVFNIPRCFFYKLYSLDLPEDLNITEYNITPPPSSFNQSFLYSTTPQNASHPQIDIVIHNVRPMTPEEEESDYYKWLYIRVYELYVSSILFYLLPYTLIPILNLQLLLAIKKRRAETRRISVKHEHRLHFTKPTDLEDGLTLIVLGITVCFFICCLIPAIYNITQIAEVPPETDIAYYLLTISDTMLCVNASTDFFFYCLLGRKFRNIFLHLFCPKWYFGRKRNTSGSYYKSNYKNSETFYFSV